MTRQEIVKGYEYLPIDKRPGTMHNIFSAHMIEDITILHLCNLLKAGFIIQMADTASPKFHARERAGRLHMIEYVGAGGGVICIIKMLRRFLNTGLKETKDLVDLMRFDNQPLYINLTDAEVSYIFSELRNSLELDEPVLRITPMIETNVDEQLFVIE
jgi:ribosomal protein L7/L12